MIHVQKTFGLSERRACKAMDQPRSTQRYSGKRADIDEALASRIERSLPRQSPLRLPAGVGSAAAGRLGGEQKARAETLERAGSEGP